MMQVSVIFQSGWFNRIKDYLFDGTGNEYSCYVFGGLIQRGNRKKITGRELIFPDKEQDYEINTPASCRPSSWFLDNVLYERPRENDLIQKNLSIVDIHCHPFVHDENVSFSSIDENWQQESVRYFFQMRRYSGVHCFIVMSEHGFDGRVWYWSKKHDRPAFYRLEAITLLDYPYTRWENPHKKPRSSLNRSKAKIWDRQILAFGREGQRRMSTLRAGIVGVGGIGSIAAESLTRLGVEQFVLVDHDPAAMSNLNRYMGMTYLDAALEMPKTAITAREILRINPKATIEAIQEKVFTPQAMKALKMVDFVLLGTDTILSRAFVNEFCLQYLIPLFSLGTVINVHSSNGLIQDIFAEYVPVIPGGNSCCLNCSGLIDFQEVNYLLGSPEIQEEGLNRGYINLPGFHQPAVRPLNGVITEMVVSEIHNYFCGFKQSFPEGLNYDQKRNLLSKKDFLYPERDENIEGMFFESRKSGDSLQIIINGQGPYSSENLLNTLKQPELSSLTEQQEAYMENYFQEVATAWENKRTCPYCGPKGLLGKAENEPLTDYSQA